MSHSFKASPPNRLLSPEFLRILAVQAVFGISYASFLLLPKFLRVELKSTATEIGAMAGVALVCAAVSAPFVGFAIRKFDRRRLLALALLLEAAGAFGFLWVDDVNAYSYLLRLAQGVAFVLVFNCTATMVADFLPTQFLARGIGYLGAAMLCTNAVAPLLAEPLSESLGWPAVFVLAGGAALSCLLLLPFLGGGVETKADHSPSSAFGRPLLAIYYASLLMGVGIGVMFTFVQPFALELGANRVGDFFIGYAVTALFVRLGLGGLADRIGRSHVAVCSMILYAVVVLGTSQLSASLLGVAGAGLGVCHGFLYPALSAMGLSLASSSMRPVFMGWFSCAFNAGFALTTLGLGPVADVLGYSYVFLIAGGAIATGVLPLVLTHRSHSLVVGSV